MRWRTTTPGECRGTAALYTPRPLSSSRPDAYVGLFLWILREERCLCRRGKDGPRTPSDASPSTPSTTGRELCSLRSRCNPAPPPLLSSSQQKQLYDGTFRPIVEAVLQGYNGTPLPLSLVTYSLSLSLSLCVQVQCLPMARRAQGRRTP